jgi:hypothetical protein
MHRNSIVRSVVLSFAVAFIFAPLPRHRPAPPVKSHHSVVRTPVVAGQ